MSTTSDTQAQDAPVARSRALDVLGLLARLVLGGALLYAGLLKVTKPQASANAVHAYRILPFDVGTYVGYALPVVEILVGLVIVLGLFTRVSAAIGVLLVVVFIAGISQAWARGFSIDCGCFGGGGQVGANQTRYPQEIGRDLSFAACGAWLLWRPRSLASLDRLWERG